MLITRHYHPLWTKVASVVLVALGLGLFWSHAPIVTLGLIFYGAGIRLKSIDRASVPLSIFGS